MGVVDKSTLLPVFFRPPCRWTSCRWALRPDDGRRV